jgi:DNA-binding protein
MAKVAQKVAVRKAPKAASPAIKPVKQTLTKSALINLIAEENEIPRKTAAGVYATLENLFLGSVHPRGVGEFVLPGLLKVGLRKVPARRAGTLVRNPATGEMVKAGGQARQRPREDPRVIEAEDGGRFVRRACFRPMG